MKKLVMFAAVLVALYVGYSYLPTGWMILLTLVLVGWWYVREASAYSRQMQTDKAGHVPDGLTHPLYPIGVGRTKVDVTIDYGDAGGHETRRLITINQVSADAEGTIYLEAYCHARKEARTFRGDRVKYFVNRDGVIVEPRDYLTGPLKIDLWSRSIRAKKPSPGWPYA